MLVLAIAAVAGCTPLVTLSSLDVIEDRRSLGAQTDDAAIELKATGRASKIVGLQGRVVVVSFNRHVLLTGEVVDEKMKLEIQQQIETIDGVRLVMNELVIGPISSIGARANDALITGKVKAAFIDARGLNVNAFKIHTDRKVVYVMGRVTETEKKLGTEVARSASTMISKVVLLTEVIGTDQIQQQSKSISGSKPDTAAAESARPSMRQDQPRNLEDATVQRKQAAAIAKMNLQVSHTQPSAEGDLTIDIQTNTDTASLMINNQEFGGRADGKYSIKRVARAGQDTQFVIVARDVGGYSDSKTITVKRQLAETKVVYPALNPAQVRRQPERDAVAIVIGIADYKNFPRADYANDDARVFYDYAIRALGIKPDNIKLLVDADADELEIIKAFKTWLPGRVRSTTDVYVYYSGHGLPAQDGQGLFLLPARADRDFIARTSIQLQEINADIMATKPRSVTLFMDACYSGQARSGETLVASARPVVLKADKKLFPDHFTVITASQSDQISSASPDLKHGIFSYYLMRGMEGDADANKDGKITLGEMQAYLVENVGRQAGMMSRKQEPQLIGEASRVLVGR